MSLEKGVKAMFLEGSGAVRKSEEAAASPQLATILLVEDEDRVREVMELALSLSGYHVLSVESCIEALEIIENYNDTIHLLVTDFALPYMNGADLAARFKKARPLSKVLFVSGFPKQDVQEFHETNGRDILEFLQKPFTPEALESKVSDMLAADD